MLEDTQIERYSRQIILPQVGGKGQEKLLRSRVYVDGDGLLAAAALLYLAAAGVGTIGAARSKAAPLFSALAEPSLGRLNPDCTLVTHPDEPGENAPPPPHYDLILATTDTLHDRWHAQHKPFVWGAINAAGARLFLSRGDRAGRPCLRCLFSLAWRAVSPTPNPQPPTPSLRLLCRHPTRHRSPENHPPARGGQPPKLLACTFPAFHCTEQTVEQNPHCPVCSTPTHD